MRIGLLTLYSEDNPGQFFQALATVNALRSTFPDAEVTIPDVQHWAQPPSPASRRDALLRPWRNVQRRRRRAAYDRARRDYLPIRGPKLVTPDPVQAVEEIARRGYDLLVVGSDASIYLWGPAAVKDNLPTLHWLYNLPKVPRVMLGACSHTLRYEQLNDAQRQIMTRAVKEFAFIAVRDPLSMELIRALGPADGVPVHVVHDPTFSYTVDPAPARALAERCRLRRSRPICGLRLPWKTDASRALVSLLKRHFDVVDLSGNYFGCKALLDLGPLEWSGILTHFDLHVTTGFHETIFCLKQGVPVYTVEGAPSRFDAHSMKSKVWFVHEAFGTLEGHYFNPYGHGATPEEILQSVQKTWRTFDREGARRRAGQIGRRYMQAVEEMRRIVGPLLGLNV